MLSLGLTSLLLVAVYSALQMHWTYSTLGQAEMERSQVARKLFRRIETDLRSVIFRAAPLSSSSTDPGSSSSSNSGTNSTSSSSTSSSSGSTTPSGGGTGATGGTGGTGGTGSSGSGSTNSSSSNSTNTDPTQQSSTQKTGLFGDSQSLIVHASLPSRASSGLGPSPSSAGTAAAMTSDQQSVAYFLVGSSSTLAQQLSQNLASSGAVPYGQKGTGLARMQGDRMAMQAADESGDDSVLSTRVQVLAPEVASIQFEFFDGVSWTDTWDSGTSSSVPNAVRITIEFFPPNTPHGGWFARPVNPSTNRYQHVVALPLAEPYVDSTSF